MTVWDDVLEVLRESIPGDDFRRWFGSTAYASDSGDQITVWVLSETVRRHLSLHYTEHLSRALTAINRPDTEVRFIVGGMDEDDEE